MEVAPQHPEGERIGAGKGVEERLLLGGVALQRGHIAGRRVEGAVPVEADLADAAASGLDQTEMAAREAPDGAPPPPPLLLSPSCRAIARTSSVSSGRPLGSKVATVTTAFRMWPSWSHSRSVWPVRSMSNWIFQCTVTSARLESAFTSKLTGTPTCSHCLNAVRI